VETPFTLKAKAREKERAKEKAKPTKAKLAGRERNASTLAIQLLLLPINLCSFAHSASNSSNSYARAWSIGSSSNPVTPLTEPFMQDINPDKPYYYCYFHGWNFTHKGLICKKMHQAFDMDKLHAVNPTSTTPHGNASVEPAYKSWL
jgi:hypothetical protein